MDIAGNLTAGNNIDLVTTAGITTIMAKTRFITVSYESNLEQPGSLTAYTYPYDIILGSHGGGFALNNANDRVNFRTRLRINGSWTSGLPQSYSYARHSNYIPVATSTIPETIIYLAANDFIDIACDVSKNTNISFSSTFDGIQFFHGGVLTIRQV